jgi:hypothetical protein
LVLGGAVAGLIAVSGTAAALATRDGDAPDGGSNPGPSGMPVVTVPAAAGGICGWQQEGDTATDAAGHRLRCVRTADGYTWQLS